MCMLSHFSHVLLFVTLWTVAHQAPLSMGSSRQEYWSGLPCPPPGDIPNLGIEPMSLMSPALAGRFFTTSATWEAQNRRVPYSPSQRNSNLVWVFPEADPRQESEGKKYTREMKENIGRGGRQGREAG